MKVYQIEYKTKAGWMPGAVFSKYEYAVKALKKVRRHHALETLNIIDARINEQTVYDDLHPEEDAIQEWSADIIWNNDGETQTDMLFTNAKYQEDSQEDNEVFYYVLDETELQSLMSPNSKEDFTVLRYEEIHR
jgi:hypothetical protein